MLLLDDVLSVGVSQKFSKVFVVFCVFVVGVFFRPGHSLCCGCQNVLLWRRCFCSPLIGDV